MTGRREPLAVVFDSSPLSDARATAGIGRYTDRLLSALRQDDRVDVRAASPRSRARSQHWLIRWARAQPSLLLSGARVRPDVIHAPANEAVIRVPGASLVVTVHDVVAWTEPYFQSHWYGRRFLAAQRNALASRATVIVPSEVVASAVEETLGIPSHRIATVAEGVDAAFSPVASEADQQHRAALSVPDRYLLWVGSLRTHDPRKATDTLLESIAAMRQKERRLVMVGAVGDESARVSARANQLGIAVTMTGRVSDAALAALYRGATAVVVPSLHEGFGLPVLEAMACGAPVVATRAGNIPALAGTAALLVAPGDAGALKRGIEAVLGNELAAARMRAAGPERARSFTWERTAALTVDVYEAAARR